MSNKILDSSVTGGTIGERRTQTERRDKAERRLFRAAVELIAEHGLDRLTLADVGEAAGYSRGLPAHYFGNKAGLIVAIAERLVEGFGAALARSELPASGLERLFRAIRFYFDSCAKDPVSTRALFVLLGQGLSNPLIRDRIARLNAQGSESLATYIEAAIQRGEARSGIDAQTQGLLLMAQLRGAVGFWLLSRDEIDLAAVRDEMIAAVRRNLAQ